jgi:hypothetical protein
LTCRFINTQENNLHDSIIRGKFELDGFNMGASLELKDDNTFHHRVSVWSCVGGGEIEEFIGEYSFNKNKIIFTPSIIIKSEFLNDSLYKKDTINYDIQKHDFRVTLFIIHWDYSIYLLSNENLSLWGFPSECDFLEFVNDINSGYYVHPNIGSYWKINCQIKGDSIIKDLIPSPWNDLLLDNIIEASTIMIKPYKSKRDYEMIKSIVKIDKGAKDGVKKGMKFYSDEKEDCACDIEIFEVNNDYSLGYSQICGPDDCMINTKLSTYLKREQKTIDYYKDK